MAHSCFDCGKLCFCDGGDDDTNGEVKKCTHDCEEFENENTSHDDEDEE